MKSPPQRESAACRRGEIFFSNKAGPSVDTSIKGEAGVAPPPVCKIEVKAVLEGFSSIKEQVPLGKEHIPSICMSAAVPDEVQPPALGRQS